MLYTLKNRELRHKLEWFAEIILLTRVISMIPVPGVDATVFKQWITQNSNDALNLFSSFTGGAFKSFSIFALGITPLITAQIIIQLMTGIVPSLAKLQKKGNMVKKDLNGSLILELLSWLLYRVAAWQSALVTVDLSVAVHTKSFSQGGHRMMYTEKEKKEIERVREVFEGTHPANDCL